MIKMIKYFLKKDFNKLLYIYLINIVLMLYLFFEEKYTNNFTDVYNNFFEQRMGIWSIIYIIQLFYLVVTEIRYVGKIIYSNERKLIYSFPINTYKIIISKYILLLIYNIIYTLTPIIIFSNTLCFNFYQIDKSELLLIFYIIISWLFFLTMLELFSIILKKATAKGNYLKSTFIAIIINLILEQIFINHIDFYIALIIKIIFSIIFIVLMKNLIDKKIDI